MRNVKTLPFYEFDFRLLYHIIMKKVYIKQKNKKIFSDENFDFLRKLKKFHGYILRIVWYDTHGGEKNERVGCGR